ncbi:MAG: hypothetical protein U0931_21945 [Vulcanimicrobiota bacterium]
MKKWWWIVLLAGCQQAPGPVSVTTAPAASTPTMTATAAPVVTASATPGAGAVTSPAADPALDLNGAVRATANFVHLGLTNQARCDMLVAHLNEAGKNQLWVTWEAYPAAAGVFEVTYVIEPLSNLTDVKKPTVSKRGNPFDRPKRAHNNGIYLEWLYDSNKKSCTARNEAASALMGLKPSLDNGGLESALPAAWKTAAAPVEETTPVVVPVATTAPAVETGSSEPIQFTGFMGAGSSRRAVLTQSGETFAVGPGDKVGPYKVRSVAEDELELARGEDTVRLMPGQVWTP